MSELHQPYDTVVVRGPNRICKVSDAFNLRLHASETSMLAPTPLLDLTFRLRNRETNVPLESATLKVTRPLTSHWLLLLLGAAYIVALALFSRANSFLTPSDSFLTCTSTYWLGNDGCGLNGQDCFPFDDTSFDFRCPAQCKSVVLANPRTVGDEQVDQVPLIVGGGDPNQTYRGDSFICAAAMHA